MIAEYLASLPPQTLKKRFHKYIPENALYSPGAIVRQIITDSLTAQRIEERYQRLSKPSQNALTSLAVCNPPRLSKADLEERLPVSQRSKAQAALQELENALFLHPVNGNEEFAVFEEITPKVRELSVFARVRKQARKPPPSNSGPHAPLWNDLTTLLILANTGQLHLTAKSEMSKRSLRILSRNLQQPAPDRLSLTDQLEKAPPVSRFGTLIGYAIDREWVNLSGKTLTLSHTGLNWLQWSRTQRTEDFLCYAFHRNPLPLLDLSLLNRILIQCEGWTPLKWLLTAYIEEPVNGESPAKHHRIQSLAEFPALLRSYCFAGLLELGWNEKNGDSFARITPGGLAFFARAAMQPLPPATPVISPNLEGIVPAETRLSTRFKLGSFADLTDFDQVYRMRITKASVLRALERLGSVEKAYEELNELQNQFAWPESVVKTLHGWLQQSGRIKIARAGLLAISDASLMAELKAIAGLAPYLKEEIPGYGFAVELADVEAIRELLSCAGYLPLSAALPGTSTKPPLHGQPQSFWDLVDSKKEQ